MRVKYRTKYLGLVILVFCLNAAVGSAGTDNAQVAPALGPLLETGQPPVSWFASLGV